MSLEKTSSLGSNYSCYHLHPEQPQAIHQRPLFPHLPVAYVQDHAAELKKTCDVVIPIFALLAVLSIVTTVFGLVVKFR